MAIHVKSEIGKLKKVMLHRPGQELEHLVPEDLERLLFDDIPYQKYRIQFLGYFDDNFAEIRILEDEDELDLQLIKD